LALSQHELARVLEQRGAPSDTASIRRLRDEADANATTTGVALA
jgi:hypothetical protein